MELKLINEQGQEANRLQASDVLFGREYNESLVHQVVVAYQANARSGNRAQKDREQVKHTTAKPFRQKGTGREDFSQKLNRKMYRAGMASIFSQLAREDRLAVVESIAVDAPKTKLFAQKIKSMGYDSVLVLVESHDENVFLASRNLPNVLVLEVNEADPVSLIRFPKVLMTKSALAKFEEMLG